MTSSEQARVYLGDAHVYCTRKDEEAGYPETRKRLASYSDADLIREYHDATRDGLGEMFGHNARAFGNLVVDELLSRGITEVPNIFGPIPVDRFRP